MNRRSLILAASGAVVLASIGKQTVARQDDSDPRWDDSSQLFGNAFDVLAEAAEGEVAFVAVSNGRGNVMSAGVSFVGVLHNHTGNDVFVSGIQPDSPEITDMSMNTVTYFTAPTIITAGALALVEFTLYADVATDEPAPPLKVQYFPAAEADAEGWYLEPTIPLKIEQFTVGGDGISYRVTNDSDERFDEASIEGMVMFFDGDGVPLSAVRLVETAQLDAGASTDVDQMVFESIDASAMFLAGASIFVNFSM